MSALRACSPDKATDEKAGSKHYFKELIQSSKPQLGYLLYVIMNSKMGIEV